jgi:hypothetical protein
MAQFYSNRCDNGILLLALYPHLTKNRNIIFNYRMENDANRIKRDIRMRARWESMEHFRVGFQRVLSTPDFACSIGTNDFGSQPLFTDKFVYDYENEARLRLFYKFNNNIGYDPRYLVRLNRVDSIKRLRYRLVRVINQTFSRYHAHLGPYRSNVVGLKFNSLQDNIFFRPYCPINNISKSWKSGSVQRPGRSPKSKWVTDFADSHISNFYAMLLQGYNFNKTIQFNKNFVSKKSLLGIVRPFEFELAKRFCKNKKYGRSVSSNYYTMLKKLKNQPHMKRLRGTRFKLLKLCYGRYWRAVLRLNSLKYILRHYEMFESVFKQLGFVNFGTVKVFLKKKTKTRTYQTSSKVLGLSMNNMFTDLSFFKSDSHLYSRFSKNFQSVNIRQVFTNLIDANIAYRANVWFSFEVLNGLSQQFHLYKDKVIGYLKESVSFKAGLHFFDSGWLTVDDSKIIFGLLDRLFLFDVEPNWVYINMHLDVEEYGMADDMAFDIYDNYYTLLSIINDEDAEEDSAATSIVEPVTSYVQLKEPDLVNVTKIPKARQKKLEKYFRMKFNVNSDILNKLHSVKKESPITKAFAKDLFIKPFWSYQRLSLINESLLSLSGKVRSDKNQKQGQNFTLVEYERYSTFWNTLSMQQRLYDVLLDTSESFYQVESRTAEIETFSSLFDDYYF